jgi:hypothetical protein
MPKKIEPQTFEIAPYSDVPFGIKEAHQVVMQIFRDVIRDAPAHAVWADMTGDLLKIHHNTYTMLLPQRMPQVEDESRQILDSTVSYLKKEFRTRTGKALKMPEQKELAGRTIEKVSLNERYMFKCWRVFKVSL